MNLTTSKLLLALSFTTAACDGMSGAPDAAPEEAVSPAYTALADLGPERRMVSAAHADQARLLAEAAHSRAAMNAVRRLTAEGFAFAQPASAFWTEGEGGQVGTVFQRGVRDGEGVTVATVLTPDFNVVSTLEFSGAGDGLEVFDIGSTQPTEIDIEGKFHESQPHLGMTEAPLVSYATGSASTGCRVYGGLVASGAQIAGGLCSFEASITCTFIFLGEGRQIRRCIAERQSVCGVASDKWNPSTCN